jgi:hypothetical protein
VRLYQALLAFHAGDPTPDARVDADLHRPLHERGVRLDRTRRYAERMAELEAASAGPPSPPRRLIGRRGRSTIWAGPPGSPSRRPRPKVRRLLAGELRCLAANRPRTRRRLRVHGLPRGGRPAPALPQHRRVPPALRARRLARLRQGGVARPRLPHRGETRRPPRRGPGRDG